MRQIHNSQAIEFNRICGSTVAFPRDNKEIGVDQGKLQTLPTVSTQLIARKMEFSRCF